MIEMKKCSRCKRNRNAATQFYHHRPTNVCKKCTIQASTESYYRMKADKEKFEAFRERRRIKSKEKYRFDKNYREARKKEARNRARRLRRARIHSVEGKPVSPQSSNKNS